MDNINSGISDSDINSTKNDEAINKVKTFSLNCFKSELIDVVDKLDRRKVEWQIRFSSLTELFHTHISNQCG